MGLFIANSFKVKKFEQQLFHRKLLTSFMAVQVMKLKGMLREQGCRTQQVSAGYTTEVSAEETVESTSELALRCSKIHHHHHQIHQQQQNTANADQGNCSLTHTHSHMAEDCSTVPVMSYWPGLPYYP